MSYNGILFSPNEEGNPAIHDMMDLEDMMRSKTGQSQKANSE